jgi:hypothetical protein
MFIEHIDQLRCTSGHEESWLVASITKREDRFVLEATLGCHICRRQYLVTDGVAYFGTTPGDHRETIAGEASADSAVRVAAFLNAAEHSTLVLAGEWGIQAHPLAAMIPMTVFVLAAGGGDSAQVARIESSEGIPLAHASVHGVALDAATATPRNIETAVHVLRPGGRLVAPVETDVPASVTVLVRDSAYWVGEREGTREFVPLRRHV